MRIGVRNDVTCDNIVTVAGDCLPWVDEIRYLGIFVVKACYFKVSVDEAKKKFYRASNAVFCQVGRYASEEVVLELLTKKCLPVLLYGLEACVLNKTQEKSLDFPSTRFLMKLFKTVNNVLIQEIRQNFNCIEPSKVLKNRRAKFVKKYAEAENVVCTVCAKFS